MSDTFPSSKCRWGLGRRRITLWKPSRLLMLIALETTPFLMLAPISVVHLLQGDAGYFSEFCS